MREIEAKILDIDRVAVEARLAELGAEQVFSGPMQAAFFDFPDGRLTAGGHLLRLRREGDRSLLTLKRRVGECGAKIREETEVEVGNLEAGRELLAGLGMVETEYVEKHRTSFRLGRARVEIDRHEGGLAFLPEFLEIEAGSVEELRAVAAQLGFKPEAIRPWGLPEVIEHYRGHA